MNLCVVFSVVYGAPLSLYLFSFGWFKKKIWKQKEQQQNKKPLLATPARLAGASTLMETGFFLIMGVPALDIRIIQAGSVRFLVSGNAMFLPSARITLMMRAWHMQEIKRYTFSWTRNKTHTHTHPPTPPGKLAYNMSNLVHFDSWIQEFWLAIVFPNINKHCTCSI